MPSIEWKFQGFNGSRYALVWDATNAEQLLIISHGYGEHMGRYEQMGGELSRAGVVVAGSDHTGHGRSAGPRVSIDDLDDLVEDLHHIVTLVRERHPGLPATLLGHSLGGLIAARYAQLHADMLDRLVLSSPVLGSWRTLDRLLDAENLPGTPLRPELLSRDLDVGRAYTVDPLVWHGGFRPNTVKAIATAMQRFNDGPKIVGIPVLWLHGTRDRLVPIEGTRTGIRRSFGTNVSEYIFDGARHELFNESNRDEVMATLVAFLRSTDAYRHTHAD